MTICKKHLKNIWLHYLKQFFFYKSVMILRQMCELISNWFGFIKSIEYFA